MKLTLDRIAARRTGATVTAPVQLSTRPTVSVVIPCYNYGHFLPQCLDSVLQQPGVGLEVIVVDDASPDGSGDVAQRLADQDARVGVLRHEQNRGHIATYNDGIAAATGDYIVLLSADDLLTPGSLARAVALLEANPDVGFAYGDTLDFVGDERPDPRTTARGWALWPGDVWLARRFRTSRNVIRTCEVVMRASVQREIGDYRPELPQLGDLDMWMRAAGVGDVGYVRGADQAFYRLHADNMHATLHQGRQLSGVLRDLHERRLTFELLADLAPAASDLDAARISLAREALTAARRAYTFATTDHAVADGFIPLLKTVARRGRSEADGYADVEKLVLFAEDVYPGAHELVEWREVAAARADIGRGRRNHNPYHLARDAALRARHKAERWPWQHLGS